MRGIAPTLEVLGGSSHQKLLADMFESAESNATESIMLLQLTE